MTVFAHQLGLAEPLTTIPQLAREFGETRSTTWRRLLAMHNRDVLDGKGGWLIVEGRRRKMRVNKSLLFAQHPELAHREPVALSEVEVLRQRVSRLEHDFRGAKRQNNALGARLRRLESHRLSVANGRDP